MEIVVIFLFIVIDSAPIMIRVDGGHAGATTYRNLSKKQDMTRWCRYFFFFHVTCHFLIDGTQSETGGRGQGIRDIYRFHSSGLRPVES